jgi:UDP-N-acetyl-2-amino-2-deoxyglucuronate dehydrogenase
LGEYGASSALKVGIIGAGDVSKLHAFGYKGVSNARVVAVADTIKERANYLAKDLGAHKVYESANDLLRDPEVQAVDICVPPAYHASIAVAGAEAGKHMLLEKPMATSLAGCDEIIDATRRNHVSLMLAHSLRFFPPLVKVKELIDAGGVGRLIRMRATLMSPFPYKKWRLDPSISGGGVLTEYGVHPIYLTQWFLGKIDRVFAFTGGTREGLKVEETAIAVLESKDGKFGIIDLNLNGPHPLWDDHLEFVGTKGYILANGVEKQILRGPPCFTIKTMVSGTSTGKKATATLTPWIILTK